MTERKMTPKGFLHKARIAKSAIAFLDAHKEYLLTGEVAALTAPIVSDYVAGKTLATPALSAIQNVVLGHMLAQESIKGLEAMEKANEPKVEKAYVVTVYNANGTVATRVTEQGETKDVTDSFELGQRANEWADRRLFEQESGAYAHVVATKLITANGPMTEVIKRDQAIERLFPKKPGPAMHVKKGNGKLSFGVKCSNDVSKFSRG